MTKILNQIALGLLVLAVTSQWAVAQPTFPNPNPNQCSTTSPTGLLAVAAVYYDPSDGVLWLDTLGLDRISNTVGGTMIGGDDFGVLSILVEGPQPINSIPPFTDGNFDPTNGIAWSYQYFGGRAQLIGTVVTGQYILPGFSALFQYEPGLVASDFDEVALLANFGAGTPGAISPCVVTVLPEPTSIMLLGASLLGLGALRRRYLG